MNSLFQVLLLKPYKVKDKNGNIKIAYNEREWRKSFLELHYISEYKPDGKINDDYLKWEKTTKPHFTDKHTLDLEVNDIKCIFVDNKDEKKILNDFINDNISGKSIDVFTLEECIESENKTTPI